MRVLAVWSDRAKLGQSGAEPSEIWLVHTRLADSHVIPCPTRVQDGTTGLMASAESGHLEVVTLLLDSKAKIDAANQVPQSTPSPALLPGHTHGKIPIILYHIISYY